MKEQYRYTVRSIDGVVGRCFHETADQAAAKIMNCSIAALVFGFQVAMTDDEPGIAMFHLRHKPEKQYCITWKPI